MAKLAEPATARGAGRSAAPRKVTARREPRPTGGGDARPAPEGSVAVTIRSPAFGAQSVAYHWDFFKPSFPLRDGLFSAMLGQEMTQTRIEQGSEVFRKIAG